MDGNDVRRPAAGRAFEWMKARRSAQELEEELMNDKRKHIEQLEALGVRVITDQAAQQCDFCGEIRELRPYGPNGETICFQCATATPQAEAAAKRAFMQIMDDGV